MQDATAAEPPPSTGDAATRLMIVEDEFVVACDLCDTLENLGYAVVASVGTGEEAIELARSARPNAILMDIRLAGDLDGVQAAARIRSESDIPIVFLSAHSSEETVRRATETAPFGYLVKPFRAPELRCAIEVAIRRHRAEKAAAEEHRRRVGAELERAAARTGELEAVNHELEAFSYSVAHDLRAPLRGITGFSEILLQDHAAELGTDGLEYLRTVQRSARRMHLLIEDLLRLSRTSHGELERDPVDLSRIAHEVLNRLRAAEPHRSVTVDITDDIMVAGDRGLLELVLENLLGNAWKFTARRDEALIEVGATRDGDRLVCFVRDNGAGFDADQASRLFSAFQRLHAASEFEGTGIGLAIVQRIVERHGGRIWAEGAVDAGATFYFAF
ncbi:MAG TPA: ATP-binding protein [Kofleriaceae bacterium]|nr:ATP-binding protein [Kofleriaceae bacterium]